MIMPNLSYQILLALVYYGNDAQARTSVLKQNPKPEDFSQYTVPGHGVSGSADFSYTNNRQDSERCEAAKKRWEKRHGWQI